MKLRYINLCMNGESGYDENFEDCYSYHTRFINHFLSIQVRKLHIETNDFRMVAIEPVINNKIECKIISDNALNINLPFNKDMYEKMNSFERTKYNLELISKAYDLAYKEKFFTDTQELLKLNKLFETLNYKNEWLHKRKTFKELNLEVYLNCYFTINQFELKISAYDLKNKLPFLEDQMLLKTWPDEVFFDYKFKDIMIVKDKLIVTNKFDEKNFIIDLENLFNGKLKYKEKGRDKEELFQCYVE
jgi:hypothetical protein